MLKGTYDFDGVKLEVGKQDFISETVDITVDGRTEKCSMFSDSDGDIGFIYKDSPVYFRYVNY